MITTIDNSALTAEQRGYVFRENLEDYVDDVAKVMPLLTFKVDAHCLTRDWNKDKPDGKGGTGAYDHKIYRVMVYQDGERLGSLESSTRYNRSVGREAVYGVESFRIEKERGRDNTTFTKDKKVALRLIKKNFVARHSLELRAFLLDNVNGMLQALNNTRFQQVRYDINLAEEAMVYALSAYEARKQGKTEVTLPTKLVSVRNEEEHYEHIAKYQHTKALWDYFVNKTGYCINVQADGKIVVYDMAKDAVHKYSEINEMPTEVANKFVMFKVLEKDDAYAHIGVKLMNEFSFVAP